MNVWIFSEKQPGEKNSNHACEFVIWLLLKYNSVCKFEYGEYGM